MPRSLLDGTTTLRYAYVDAEEAFQVKVVSGGLTASDIDVVDQLDTPFLDGTTINGSGGAFLQVIASLAADVVKAQCLDTTGEYIGLYVGPAASEVLEFIIGPGSDQTIDVKIPAGSRISLRAMDTTAPTVGNLSINFLG